MATQNLADRVKEILQNNHNGCSFNEICRLVHGLPHIIDRDLSVIKDLSINYPAVFDCVLINGELGLKLKFYSRSRNLMSNKQYIDDVTAILSRYHQGCAIHTLELLIDRKRYESAPQFARLSKIYPNQFVSFTVDQKPAVILKKYHNNIQMNKRKQNERAEAVPAGPSAAHLFYSYLEFTIKNNTPNQNQGRYFRVTDLKNWFGNWCQVEKRKYPGSKKHNFDSIVNILKNEQKIVYSSNTLVYFAFLPPIRPTVNRVEAEADRGGIMISHIHFPDFVATASEEVCEITVTNTHVNHTHILTAVNALRHQDTTLTFVPTVMQGISLAPQTIVTFTVLFHSNSPGVFENALIFTFAGPFSITRPYRIQCGNVALQELVAPSNVPRRDPHERRSRYRDRGGRGGRGRNQRTTKSYGTKPASGCQRFLYDLPAYTIPKAYKEIPMLEGLEHEYERLTMFLEHSHLVQHDYTLLQNTTKYYDMLLYHEEEGLKDAMEQYALPSAQFQHTSGRLYRLTVPGLAEKRPSVLRGDGVTAIHCRDVETDGITKYVGYIWEVTRDAIIINFSQQFAQAYYPQNTYQIEFLLRRTQLQMMHDIYTRIADLCGIVKTNLLSNHTTNTTAIAVTTANNEQMQRTMEELLIVRQLLFPREGERMLANGDNNDSNYLYQRRHNQIEWENTLLNAEQQSAVRKIVFPNPATYSSPFIIFGPPGTGKTSTVVEAIQQVYLHAPNKKYLVLTPSNLAADLIIERLSHAAYLDSTVMYRLMSYQRDPKDVSSIVKGYTTYSEALGGFQFPSITTLASYSILVTTCSMACKLYYYGYPTNTFDTIFLDECGHCLEPEVIASLLHLILSPSLGPRTSDHMSPGVAILADILADNHNNNNDENNDENDDEISISSRNAEEQIVSNNDEDEEVLAQLLSSLQQLTLKNSKASSSSSTSLLQMKRIPKIVLAGDPRQLGPVVHSIPGKEYNLGISYLERLIDSVACYAHQPNRFPDTMGYNPDYIIQLIHCYRCHEVIIHQPNIYFYHSSLRCCGLSENVNRCINWSGLPSIGFPMIFHHCIGESRQDMSSPSWYNPTEIELVMLYVTRLLSDRTLQLTPADIGIITPYHRQVMKIRQALQHYQIDSNANSGTGNANGLRVGSCEQFQGQERRVIIISTVRSSTDLFSQDSYFQLGFVNDPKRFNVAMTRAQALVIVIGNGLVLSTDHYWRGWIEYCQLHNAMAGEYLHLPENEVEEVEETADIVRVYASMNANTLPFE